MMHAPVLEQATAPGNFLLMLRQEIRRLEGGQGSIIFTGSEWSLLRPRADEAATVVTWAGQHLGPEDLEQLDRFGRAHGWKVRVKDLRPEDHRLLLLFDPV